MEYDLIYFGQLRTFNNNLKSHMSIIKGATNILISTWDDEKIPLELYEIRNDIHVVTQRFSEKYFKEIGSCQLPLNVINDEFGRMHYRAMLPKHLLIQEAFKYYNTLKSCSTNALVLLRPDLFIYDSRYILNNLSNSIVRHTKDSADELSDQLLIGNSKSIEEVFGDIDSISQDWDFLYRNDERIEFYINEGYLRWRSKNKDIATERIEKCFEINRDKLHLYRWVIKFFPGIGFKNKFIGLLKRVGLWRKY